MDETKIKAEAKEIMNNFMNSLTKIKIENNYIKKRKVSLRNETNPNSIDEDFRNRFLSNAPRTSGNAILANKGEWTKKGK